MAATNNQLDSSPSMETIVRSRQIDILADSFERDWTEKSILRLEDILADVTENLKGSVREELLTMDFELRFQNGKQVNPDHYVRSFPQYETEIRSVYQTVMDSRQLGEYEFYELLGKGGMGSIYRGKHRLLGRYVAIKLMNQHALNLSGARERFLQEIHVCGQLRHPNIIHTEFAGVFRNQYYIVMELLDGEDIRKIITRRKQLPLPAACEIVRQTATGIQYAFEHGIIHRDIKPGNLMISRNGIVKIIDFGLGKLIVPNHSEKDSSLTTYGTTMGSIDYVAPEQLTDAASATIQSDIYSLGCVFFFLLTGQAPFDSKSMSRDQKLIAHIKGEIPPLKQFYENLPPEIDKLYQKMVAREPKERFRTPLDIINLVTPFALPEGLRPLLSEETSVSGGAISSFFQSRYQPVPVSARIWSALKRYLPKTLILLLVGYGVYYYGTTRRNDFSASPQKLPDILSREPNRQMAVSKNLTAEILQFPGYSGKWWFEEVPYLLPFVRERIAVPETRLTHLLMNNPHEAKGAKENDLPILTTLSQESETVQRLIEFLVKAGQTMEQKDSNRRNLTDLEPLVDQYLSEIPEHSPSASVLHTQAVLLHYLSVFLQKTNREQQARELYARAIQLYETETNESSLFLCKLCRFDAARLEYWINGNADEFQRQANAIEVGDADDLAFRLNLMIVPAVEQMKAGRNQDAVFTGAFQLLEQLERLEPLEQKESPHPMRTALHFLYADVLSRQWRLEPAEIHWRTLEKLATQKALQDKTNEREARFCCGAGCAKLALAAISRYFGDLNKARYRYRELIGNIQDTLSMTSGAQKESVHLTRQLAESWEGLADCTLFVPTHFDKTSVSVVNAPFFIGEAETGYRQAYDLAADPAIKFVLQCKLALLRFNAENLNETNQQHSLNELRTRFQELSSMDVDYERAKEYHDLTEAVLGISNENIQAYLDQNRLNPNLCDRYAGERLDLQLFAIRSLLLSERTTNCFAAQQDIKRYLDPILLQHLVLENKMRPFLLPFYDLAICSPEDNDFVQITARIRAARCQHSLNRLSKKQLVFYFPLDNSNGFTFFLSPDEHENQRFNLGVNRRQVIEAADNGQTLPLPADLVQRVNVTWEQSERLGVSWDDSVCWTDSQAKKRLTLLQWIFNSNIDRDRLLGTIR